MAMDAEEHRSKLGHVEVRSGADFFYSEGDRVLIRWGSYGGKFGTIVQNSAGVYDEVLVDGEAAAKKFPLDAIRAVYEFDEKVYSGSVAVSDIQPLREGGKKRRLRVSGDAPSGEDAELIRLSKEDYEMMVYRIQKDALYWERIKDMWPPDYLLRARRECGFPAELEPRRDNGLWAQIKKMFSSA